LGPPGQPGSQKESARDLKPGGNTASRPISAAGSQMAFEEKPPPPIDEEEDDAGNILEQSL
jgi:hypothetical protein